MHEVNMKVKTYAILLRHKKTNNLYAYSKEHLSETNLSTKYARIFRQARDWNKIIRNAVIEEIEHLCKKLSKIFIDYDVFITRIGSKKCPIVVDWSDLVDAKSRGERIRPSLWYYRRFRLK